MPTIRAAANLPTNHAPTNHAPGFIEFDSADQGDFLAGTASAEQRMGFATDVGASSPLTLVLYLTEPGDSSAISVNDIHQGQIGDCFLLAAFGEMALYHPAAISNMIHFNPNGTESVTLFTDTLGRLPGFGTSAFKPTTQTVSNIFPTRSVNNGATQDVVAGKKEIWAQVIEKAYAQENGGYAGIQGGGSPFLALEQLTGHAASWRIPANLSLSELMSDAAAGDLIVMDTKSAGGLPFNLVGNHAYMFEGIKTVGGAAYVQLGNPWGCCQPGLIPFAQLSRGICEIDIGRV